MSSRKTHHSFPLLQVTALLLLFAAIAAAVFLNVTAGFDRTIILSLRLPTNIARPVGPDWAIEAIRDITSLGSVVLDFLFTAVVCGYWLCTGRRREAGLLLTSAVGALILNDLLKFGFDRPRPDAILQAARVFSSGFPSGHATISCATYFSAAILFGSQSATRDGRIYLLSGAAIIVAMIGFSRIYLGLHYPTDVLAGWCIGGAWFLSCSWLFEALRPQVPDP